VELTTFYDKCAVQNCLLQATLNKAFYEMSTLQQHVLANCGLPYFTDSFASYLVNTVGPGQYDKRSLDVLAKQRNIVEALLSLRIGWEGTISAPLKFKRVEVMQPVSGLQGTKS